MVLQTSAWQPEEKNSEPRTEEKGKVSQRDVCRWGGKEGHTGGKAAPEGRGGSREASLISVVGKGLGLSDTD